MRYSSDIPQNAPCPALADDQRERSVLLRIFILSILGLSLFASGIYWYKRDNIHTVVAGQIFRSAQLDAGTLKQVIQEKNIRTVINLRGSQPHKTWYKDQNMLLKELGITLHDLPFSATGLPPVTQLERLYQTLQDVQTPLLVHCEYGADRTGMASALAILLEPDSTVEDALRQLTPRYFILRPWSTGRLLLKQYKNWLAENGQKHDRQSLTDWIKNSYVDDNGNLRFYIDQINHTMWKSGTRYRDNYFYHVHRATNPMLEVSGWAIDIKNEHLVKQVDVLLDDKVLGVADYGHEYAGVSGYFRNDQYMKSGWMFRANVRDWKSACYNLGLRITRMDSTIWESPPQARVCLQ